MRFHPYASSSAGNLAEIESDNGAQLLLDCGLSPASLSLALRHRTAFYDGCLLSHAHGDHSAGADSVLRSSVPLFASAETLREAKLADRRLTRPLVAKTPTTIPSASCGGEWKVLPFDLPHDAPGNLGFFVEHSSGQGRLLYACDTAWIPYRFKGLSIIAVEVNYSEAILLASDVPVEQRMRTLRTHHSLERAPHWLGQLDLSRCEEIWLLHLSGAHSNADSFKSAVMEMTGCPTYVAPVRSEELR